MPTHTAINGRVIEYPEPVPKLAAILRQLRAMLDDPSVSENDMVDVAYARDNPLLGPDLFPERGAVTRETLADPAYHVVRDLLYRKRVAERGLDVERLAASYTLTIADAARSLGVHDSAVRQAISAFRLPVWVKDGKQYLSPSSLDHFRLANRGPQHRVGDELEVRMGNDKSKSLRLKYPGELADHERAGDQIVQGRVPKWRRVAAITGDKGGESKRYKCFILEPGPDENEIKWGTFYVRGKFKIANELSGPEANDEWKRFTAA